MSNQINRDLDLLAPFVQVHLSAAIAECFHAGYPVNVFEGWRSPLRQNALYAQGRTMPGAKVTNGKAWESFHQYSLAVDLAFQENGKWTKNSWDASWPWEKVATIFMAHHFEWPKPDGEKAHFQITGGFTPKECLQITQAQGVQALWLLIESKTASLP